MKTNDKYIRKIFSLVDLKKILKLPRNKIVNQDEQKILTVFMNTIIILFLSDITRQPEKYGVDKVLDLVPQYRQFRRGVLQVNKKNLSIVYFINYQDFLFVKKPAVQQTNNLFIASEFGLSGEARLVNFIFKKLRSFIKQRSFSRWYKKATVWLKSQSNYSLLDEEIKKYFNWNHLKFGPQA